MTYLTKKEAETIMQALPKKHTEEIAAIIKKIQSPPLRRIYVTDTSRIERLLKRAFKEKRKVKINYYSHSSDEVTNRIIDIYQWHDDCIIAYCNLREDERTFVLKRINKAALLDETYTIPKGWKPESIILKK